MLSSIGSPYDYYPYFIYAPGTPLDYVQGHPTYPGGPGAPGSVADGSGGEGPARFQFQDTARWSTTATDGSGLGQGDPTVLTWGIAPDGTNIPGSGAGDAAANSNLVAFLDGIYGGGTGPVSNRPWFPIMQSVFDRWTELTGITFVYEPADDASQFAPTNNGVLGVRPDIRIGGKNIDGNAGILAYNYFPDYGEMVIDTNDNTFQQSAGQNNDLVLRNVMMHEDGHGQGYQHVCPITETKLMEPILSTSFDGPQLDDILASQRGYGDSLEPNDQTSNAFDFGSLGDTTVSLGKIANDSWISIDDTADVDLFRFANSGGSVTVTITPQGSTYLEGPQNADGSCSAGTSFDATRQSDLAVELLDSNGKVLASANKNGLGGSESISNFQLPASGEYFVRVKGAQAAVQLYSLDLTVIGSPSAPPPTTGPGISGLKFQDLDSDGIQDPNEPGLKGFYIYVDLNTNGKIDIGEPAAITNTKGEYHIDFNTVGDYEVREVLTPGWVQTFPKNNGAHQITIAPDVTNDNVDFGNSANRDYGDAPAPYPTLLADGGASSGILPGFHLGALEDGEGDGLVSDKANGDDSQGLKDEDGVRFTSPLFAGLTSTVEVTVATGSYSAGSLQGWIDFNHDGDWNDPGERIFTDVLLRTGKHNLTFPVPAGALVGPTFARFRYGYERGIGPGGPALAGEVEDYQVLVLADTPVANDDALQVKQGSINNSLDVLVNDFPSSKGPLQIVSVGTPNRGGFVSISPDKLKILYTPQTNFFSPPTETFTYTVSDGTSSTDSATVTMTVTPTFSNPVAVDDVYRVVAGSGDNSLNVLLNDIPGTNGPLTLVAVSAPGTGSTRIDNRGTSDPTDDRVIYTPSAAFSKVDQFNYTVSNQIGVLSTATVTIFQDPDPGGSELVFILETTDDQGNVISSVDVGDRFNLRVSVQDVRFGVPNPLGVAAAYLDVLYDRDLVSAVPDPTNPFGFSIQFSAQYNEIKSGSALVPGLLNEVGAFQNGFDPLGDQPIEVFSVLMVANQAGRVDFLSDPADDAPAHDVLFYDPPQVVPLPNILYGFTSLDIGGGTGESKPLNLLDVNGDGTVSPVDALRIINNLNHYGTYSLLGGGEGEQPAQNDPRLDVNRDLLVSPLDALLVINGLNKGPGPEGEALISGDSAEGEGISLGSSALGTLDVSLIRAGGFARRITAQPTVAGPLQVAVNPLPLPADHRAGTPSVIDSTASRRWDTDAEGESLDSLLDTLAPDVAGAWRELPGA